MNGPQPCVSLFLVILHSSVVDVRLLSSFGDYYSTYGQTNDASVVAGLPGRSLAFLTLLEWLGYVGITHHRKADRPGSLAKQCQPQPLPRRAARRRRLGQIKLSCIHCSVEDVLQGDQHVPENAEVCLHE